MATIHDFGGRESLQTAVARRLRGLLAEARMSKSEFAARTGWDRGYLYRRLSGETAINMADLDTIEESTRFSAAYLVSGDGPKTRQHTPGGGGGARNPPTTQPTGLASHRHWAA